MDKYKKNNEGEMGSGDSDDEFYNVKLPYTPDVASDKYAKKMEVKKVYSPPRTKVQYDYKFDSSSDEESDNRGSRRDSRGNHQETSRGSESEKNTEKKEGSVKENSNLPQSTFKVVEKINEELKNMKNAGTKALAEKAENMSSHNHAATSGANVPRPQMGMVPPVVVVPPPTQAQLLLPQASVMNMGPMIVPSAMGMSGQNVMQGAMGMIQSQNMMGISSGLLRSPTPMGGLMGTPNSGLPNSMMGMNPMQAGMVGMQGNIMGIPGQGNVMGLQRGMLNPAAMGGINMGMSGNMMRMASPGNNVMAMQGANNMIGITRPNSNIVGMPLNIPAPPGNLSGMLVNHGNVMNNAMMGNAGRLMLMGGMLANPGNMVNNTVTGTSQPNVINSSGNLVGSNSLVQMANNSHGNLPLRGVPPPPFMNLKGKPSLPGNFRWQANAKMQGGVARAGSPPSGRSRSSPGDASPPSPPDRSSKDYDGDELSRDDKEDSPSLDTDESQSPPREIPNTFKNDGSFMEMFKKMKEESSNKEGSSSGDKSRGNSEPSNSSSGLKKPSVMLSGIVGKRRGGRVLKTGLVKKVKKESDAEEEKEPKDAWAMYMAEVKKYREASCEEEGKTRPLVK